VSKAVIAALKGPLKRAAPPSEHLLYESLSQEKGYLETTREKIISEGPREEGRERREAPLPFSQLRGKGQGVSPGKSKKGGGKVSHCDNGTSFTTGKWPLAGGGLREGTNTLKLERPYSGKKITGPTPFSPVRGILKPRGA